MNKKLAKFALPLFVFWPFGSFLYAMQNIKLRSSGIVIVLFSMVYGYSFSFTDTTADSYRTAYIFTVYDFSSFESIIALYQDGDTVDIYRFIMYGIAKLFSNNPKVLFSLCGLVFGLLLYGNLKFFDLEKKGQSGLYISLLLLFFFSLNPLTNINGFRYWTATGLFFYSMISYSIYDKKLRIIGVFLTPLIHFSYLFILPLVLVFIFLKRFIHTKSDIKKVVLVIFIATFLLSWVLDTNAISLGFLAEQEELNSSISKKVDMYNSDDTTAEIAERGKTFFHTVSKLWGYILKTYMFILLFKLRKIIQVYPDKTSVKLMAFCFVFTSFGYIATVIPSGIRFQFISYLATILLFLRVYVKYPSLELQKMIRWGFIAFAFNIFFIVGYVGFIVVSGTVWFGNLFWIIYEGIGFEVDYFF